MKKETIGEGITRYCYDTNEEWMAARKGIGGSDASSVIGQNPYKSNQELWREKIGMEEPKDISDKPYVRYGHDAEPLIRGLFALDHPELTLEYHENNMIVNDCYPWAHASLDGEFADPEGRKGVWEGKTTTIFRPGQFSEWEKRIPDNYYAQCLHYLFVTGYDMVWLTALLKISVGNERSEIRHYTIRREDVEDDIMLLKEAEEKFWDFVEKKKEPPLLLPGI